MYSSVLLLSTEGCRHHAGKDVAGAQGRIQDSTVRFKELAACKTTLWVSFNTVQSAVYQRPVARRWLSPSGRRSRLWSVANTLTTTPSRTNTYALTKPPDENNHPLGRLEPLNRTASRTSTFNVQRRHTTTPPCLAVGHAFIYEHTRQFCLDIREEDNRCSCGIADHSFHHILDDFSRYAQARQSPAVSAAGTPIHPLSSH